MRTACLKRPPNHVKIEQPT